MTVAPPQGDTVKHHGGGAAGCRTRARNCTRTRGNATDGAAFVDLSAAYDTVQHRLLIKKLFDLTAAAKLCNIIRCLLSNRMFHVTLNNKKSRWFHQNNGLPQGSVLAPLLFNVYTNDQPLPEGCSRFIYADDLAITTQQHTFPEVESTLERGLSDMSAYYLENHLRPNPGKTQILRKIRKPVQRLPLAGPIKCNSLIEVRMSSYSTKMTKTLWLLLPLVQHSNKRLGRRGIYVDYIFVSV
uniref:Reverse transcriptase domain-containing protein n=1 Tax=Hippocampus comes TaxID=109280 RepID=A0A3Q2Y4W3_HIPCM